MIKLILISVILWWPQDTPNCQDSRPLRTSYSAPLTQKPHFKKVSHTKQEFNRHLVGLWLTIEQCGAYVLPTAPGAANGRAGPDTHAEPELHLNYPRPLPATERPSRRHQAVPAWLGEARQTRASVLRVLQGERGGVQRRELQNPQGTTICDSAHRILLSGRQLDLHQRIEAGELRHPSGHLPQTGEDCQ